MNEISHLFRKLRFRKEYALPLEGQTVVLLFIIVSTRCILKHNRTESHAIDKDNIDTESNRILINTNTLEQLCHICSCLNMKRTFFVLFCWNKQKKFCSLLGMR